MTTEAPPRQTPPGRQLDRVTIRFAGDSGDGMQLTGTQFTRTAAAFGNDISTFPDYPAEIRAPAGSLPGVSGFQLSFSSTDIHTPGDAPDVLVAMNPAALKANLGELPAGGALIVNEDAFTPQNLAKVGYAANPLTDGSLKAWNVFSVPISALNSRALEGLGLTNKQVDLTKNFFALGLMFWLYERDMSATLAWIDEKFSKRPEIAEGNRRSSTSGTSCRRRSSSPGRTGTSPATRRRPSATSRRRSSPGGRCSTARTRSPRPRTSSTSSPATRTSASRRSRRRTRSLRSGPRSARATAARWA
jgi:2-oxoglutarate ferredoxin oxidoreductase subunit alpha